MRIALAAALALSLSACSDWNGSFFGDSDVHEAQAQPAESAPPPPPMEPAPVSAAPAPVASAQGAPPPAAMAEAPPPPPPPPAGMVDTAPANTAPRPASDHCIKLARARAGDAAYQGEDEDTQHSVYDRTYADCMDWDAKHAL